MFTKYYVQSRDAGVKAAYMNLKVFLDNSKFKNMNK